MLISRWLSKRRKFSRLVDQEAAALFAREGVSGYYTARRHGLVAEEQDQTHMAGFWKEVGLRIAARADLAPYRRPISGPICDWLFNRGSRIRQS